jgi:DNA-binding Xre family transcriptional regulator
MKKKDLMVLAKLSLTTIAKMSKNQPIDGSILEKICAVLSYRSGGVIEYIPE